MTSLTQMMRNRNQTKMIDKQWALSGIKEAKTYEIDSNSSFQTQYQWL